MKLGVIKWILTDIFKIHRIVSSMIYGEKKKSLILTLAPPPPHYVTHFGVQYESPQPPPLKNQKGLCSFWASGSFVHLSEVLDSFVLKISLKKKNLTQSQNTEIMSTSYRPPNGAAAKSTPTDATLARVSEQRARGAVRAFRR